MFADLLKMIRQAACADTVDCLNGGMGGPSRPTSVKILLGRMQPKRTKTNQITLKSSLSSPKRARLSESCTRSPLISRSGSHGGHVGVMGVIGAERDSFPWTRASSGMYDMLQMPIPQVEGCHAPQHKIGCTAVCTTIHAACLA